MANNYYRPGGFSFFPPVIKNLLIINGIMFVIQLVGESIIIDNARLSTVIIRYFGLIPFGNFADAQFYPWQLITYQFLHGGFSHILFNMFALWMFGMEIENVWGSKRFLIFYLTCGVVAGLFHLVMSSLLTGLTAPTIGASGAIFGVMVAFAMLFPDRYIFLYFFVPVKAKYLIMFLVVLEFLAVESAGSTVAHLAHLGGAIAGFVYIMLDKNIYVDFKSSIRRQSTAFKNEYFSGKKVNKEDISEAKYYDIKENEPGRDITQAEIDAILDKISKSGYQNLTEREKKILFEASKKMK
ncbi:MAG TPA: rhomboid family intramembrane serine protease [Ignavibacteriaceae bacterium]|nr:rhomboid family intramembrane serine protease [Ignavibacteriaceae bacterium]